MKKYFLVFVVLCGCIVSIFARGSEENAQYPTKTIEFIAPAGAGGGWDLTIRTVDKVIHEADLVDFPTPVTNKPGGGGGVALAYLQKKHDADNIISVYSPPLLLINLNGSSQYSYKDLTPLARLISEYAAFVVRKDSPYRTINNLVEDLKKNTKSVKVGGVSAVGSMDHLKFLMLAKAAHISKLKEINYISFQDAGALSQLLGGHVDVYAGDLSDVVGLLESGDVRILGIASPKRLAAFPDVPTIKEQGIDMEFVNWRGLFGPKDMPAKVVSYWRGIFKKMVETPEWKKASKNNGWQMTYLDADEFSAYLNKVNKEYKAVLRSVGLLATQ